MNTKQIKEILNTNPGEEVCIMDLRSVIKDRFVLSKMVNKKIIVLSVSDGDEKYLKSPQLKSLLRGKKMLVDEMYKKPYLYSFKDSRFVFHISETISKEDLPAFIEENKKNITDPHRENLSLMLDKFKDDALAKYDRGRAEHGDTISELDIREEMYSEFIDMFNYFSFYDNNKKK